MKGAGCTRSVEERVRREEKGWGTQSVDSGYRPCRSCPYIYVCVHVCWHCKSSDGIVCIICAVAAIHLPQPIVKRDNQKKKYAGIYTANTYPLCPDHKIYLYKKYITRNRHATIVTVVTCNNV